MTGRDPRLDADITTRTHGGLSLLDVAVPFIEVSRTPN